MLIERDPSWQVNFAITRSLFSMDFIPEQRDWSYSNQKQNTVLREPPLLQQLDVDVVGLYFNS